MKLLGEGDSMSVYRWIMLDGTKVAERIKGKRAREERKRSTRKITIDVCDVNFEGTKHGKIAYRCVDLKRGWGRKFNDIAT